jgi:hypothetical protein
MAQLALYETEMGGYAAGFPTRGHRYEGADTLGEDGRGEVFAGVRAGGVLNAKDPMEWMTPGLRATGYLETHERATHRLARV